MSEHHSNLSKTILVFLILVADSSSISSELRYRSKERRTSFFHSHQPSRLYRKTITSRHPFAFQDTERRGNLVNMDGISDSGTSHDVDDACSYNDFVSASVDIKQAYMNEDVLTLVRSARDIDANMRRKYLHQILLPSSTGAKKSHILPAIEISFDEKARMPSPSGKKLAILKVEKSSSSTPKQV